MLPATACTVLLKAVTCDKLQHSAPAEAPIPICCIDRRRPPSSGMTGRPMGGMAMKRRRSAQAVPARTPNGCARQAPFPPTWRHALLPRGGVRMLKQFPLSTAMVFPLAKFPALYQTAFSNIPPVPFLFCRRAHAKTSKTDITNRRKTKRAPPKQGRNAPFYASFPRYRVVKYV